MTFLYNNLIFKTITISTMKTLSILRAAVIVITVGLTFALTSCKKEEVITPCEISGYPVGWLKPHPAKNDVLVVMSGDTMLVLHERDYNTFVDNPYTNRMTNVVLFNSADTTIQKAFGDSVRVNINEERSCANKLLVTFEDLRSNIEVVSGKVVVNNLTVIIEKI